MRATCDRGSFHQNEQLELICLNDECILSGQPLNCIICIQEEHAKHELIHVNKFLNLFKKQYSELKEQLKPYERTPTQHIQSNETQQTEPDDLVQKLTGFQHRFNATLNQIKERLLRTLRTSETLAFKSDSLPPLQTLQTLLNDESVNQNLVRKILSRIRFNKDSQTLQLRKEFLEIDEDIMQSKDKSTLYVESVARLIQNMENSLNMFGGGDDGKLQSRTYSQQSFRNRVKSNDMGRSLQIVDRIKEDVSFTSSPTSPFQPPLNTTNRSFDGFNQSRNLSRFYSSIKPQSALTQGPSSLGSQSSLVSKFSFSNEYLGDGIQLLSNSRIARVVQDVDRRLALIQPAVYGGSGATKECTIKLRINALKNLNQRFPLAIGLCVLSKVQPAKFIFTGVAEHVNQVAVKTQDHGCYLVNSNGATRSALHSHDMQRGSKLRFHSGIEVHIIFKPFQQQVVIKRFNEKDKSQEIQCDLHVNLAEGVKLYGVVRFADLSDQVEIIS